jgi:hypothetical protein
VSDAARAHKEVSRAYVAKIKEKMGDIWGLLKKPEASLLDFDQGHGG